MSVKRLIVAGDSWTYGSEIKDPSLPDTVHDWDQPNDEYRIPKIWPTKLGKSMGIQDKDIINLSYPAASNDRTVRNLVGWLTQEYLSRGKDTSELFVIVGLTSPERKDFYYRDETMNSWVTMWPMWEHKFIQEPLNKFARLYSEYFWNDEESTHRYLHQIFYLQTLFKQYNIKFLFFQAFYQRNDMNMKQWTDNPYARHYQGQPDHMVWNLIDSKTFMHKDETIHSFHNYISAKDPDPEKRSVFLNMHPSELGHTIWADHVKDYITENNLW
jgi:hypothetical protein